MMTSFKILVASYTDSIYTLEFNPDTPSPTLKYVSKVDVGRNPSWIEAHPSDRSLILACLEQAPDGQIVVVKYDRNSGEGRKVEEATCSSGGADPCSLLVTEDEIIVANYSGGTVASIPISTTPPYTRPAASWNIAVPFDAERSGRNLSRQDASHPHQVILNPLNTTEQELLVPDLGSDKVWRLTKTSDGHWAIRSFVSIDAKTAGGPRHVVMYGNTLYVLLELTSELAVYKVHASDVLTHVATLSTVKASPTPSGMNAAEILIPKPNRSFPTAYIYASNRDDPHPEGDTIAIFSLEKGEERPELVTEVRTGLKHLRGMVFGGEDNKWLVVGGVGSRATSLEGGGIKVYERVEGGKGLQQVAALDHDVGRQMRATTFLWL